MGDYQNIFRSFLEENISLPCRQETQTYITQIFLEITPQDDFSKESLTLIYNQAIQNYEFEQFRKLGDWMFFTKTLFPKSLSGASPQYYSSLARTSYDRCYKILHRQWVLYEELADQFDELTTECRKALTQDDEWLILV